MTSPPDKGGAALELAMRAGDLLLSAGMSANDVVAAMLRITRAYGLTRVHVDVTYTAIVASHQPAPGTAPVTYTRVVQPGEVDYSQVRSLFRLVGGIQQGLPRAEAADAVDAIWSASRPYPAWVATIGDAGVAAGVVMLFTTSWRVILATFVIGCVVDQVLGRLGELRLPPFFQQVVGAMLITVVSAVIATAAAHRVPFFAGLNPNLVVVGGIVMLVAGTVVVAAAQDAIDEFYVTASARMIEATTRTAGIVVGIVLAVRLAIRLDMPLSISANPVHLGPLPAQFAGAAITPALFALSVYADAATAGFAAAIGLIGWAGFAAVTQAGGGQVPASTAAALAVALTATILTRHTSVPGFGLVNAAILPLVPGLALYEGLLDVTGTPTMGSAPAQGAATLLSAIAVALGIAAGGSLGTYLGRPIADRMLRLRGRERR